MFSRRVAEFAEFVEKKVIKLSFRSLPGNLQKSLAGISRRPNLVCRRYKEQRHRSASVFWRCVPLRVHPGFCAGAGSNLNSRDRPPLPGLYPFFGRYYKQIAPNGAAQLRLSRRLKIGEIKRVTNEVCLCKRIGVCWRSPVRGGLSIEPMPTNQSLVGAARPGGLFLARNNPSITGMRPSFDSISTLPPRRNKLT
jgi:hypothetical protein